MIGAAEKSTRDVPGTYTRERLAPTRRSLWTRVWTRPVSGPLPPSDVLEHELSRNGGLAAVGDAAMCAPRWWPWNTRAGGRGMTAGVADSR